MFSELSVSEDSCTDLFRSTFVFTQITNHPEKLHFAFVHCQILHLLNSLVRWAFICSRYVYIYRILCREIGRERIQTFTSGISLVSGIVKLYRNYHQELYFLSLYCNYNKFFVHHFISNSAAKQLVQAPWHLVIQAFKNALSIPHSYSYIRL